MDRRTHKRVYIFRINYFARTKRLYDIMIIPRGRIFLARDYHTLIRRANMFPIKYCGEAFVVIGGGGAHESDLSTYKDV